MGSVRFCEDRVCGFIVFLLVKQEGWRISRVSSDPIASCGSK